MNNKQEKQTSISLSRSDVEFIYYAVNQHMEMVKTHHGMAWDYSLEKEAAYLESLKRRLPMHQGTEYPRISRNDFWFLEYTLNERNDFVNEGVGTPWFKAPKYDSLRTSAIINRLRRALGISKEEFENGMPE